MIERLKNLFFVIIGGVIVAGFSYFLFTDKPESIPELNVQHKFINISYLDSIAADWMSSKLAHSSEVYHASSLVKSNDQETEAVKELRANYTSLIEGAINWNIFNSKWYNSIHFIEIVNSTNKRISDVEFVNNFEYMSYIINNNSKNKIFSTANPRDIVNIGDINPGSKIEIVAISSLASPYNPADVIVLSSGRRQDIKYLNKEDFSIGAPLLKDYPLLVFILSSIGIISALSILIALILEVLKASSPYWRWQLTTESEYRKSKILIEFYESKLGLQSAEDK